MNWPLNYLVSHGARADAVLPLTLFMLAISVGVTLAIAALLWIAVRRRPAAAEEQDRDVAVKRSSGGVRLIVIGLAISAVPLLASLIWTVAALAQVALPPHRQQMTIDVTAHRWWWQADYGAGTPAGFSTANEIHVPVGRQVLIRLHSDNVIHSFWVPQLTGKTDLIPGQTNLSWLQANRPGRYRGQCTEYCGLQHANMAFAIVADPPAQFERWRLAQLQAASLPVTAQQMAGLALVEQRCARCHTVRGTLADGRRAPDLTHLQSRRTLAALTLPNNPQALAGWVENPTGSKPGALMPNQHLDANQLRAVTAYLESLR